MSDQSTINELYDLQKIEAQHKRALSMVKEYVAEVQKTNTISINLKNTDSTNGIAKGMKELEEAQNRLIASSISLTKSLNGSYDSFRKGVVISKESRKALQEEYKAEAQLEKKKQESLKTRQLEQKIIAVATKEKEKAGKVIASELKNQEKLNSAYQQLNHKYIIAATTAKNLAAAKGIDNAETTKAITQAQKYYQELIKIDQAVGQSQRNVGNYTSATFALTQVIREAPAFANSFATGISGISNNIPVLVDQIRKLREAGLSTSKIFSVLGGSLLSINAILPIAFLLIQSYGAEISDFFKKLFTGNRVLSESEKSWKSYSAALDGTTDSTKDAIQEVEEMKTILQLARQGVIDKDKALKFYNESIGKTTGAVKSLKEAEDELIKNGPAYIRINLLKALSSQLAADAAAQVAEKQKEIQRLEEINNTIRERIRTGDYKDLNEFNTLKAALSINETTLQAVTQAEGDKILDSYQQMIARVNDSITKIAKENDFNLTDLFKVTDDKFDDKAKRDAERRAEEAAKKAEERRKFIYETEKAIIEDRKAANQNIIEDEDKDFTVRLGALRNFLSASVELIELGADFEKNKKGISDEEIKKIEAEKQAALNQLYRDGKAERVKILDEEYQEQAEAAEKDKTDQEKGELDSFNRRNASRIAFGKMVAAILNAQDKERKKKLDEEEGLEKKKAAARVRLAQEVASALKSIFDASFENAKNRIQAEIDLLNERRQAEIEAATSSITNIQERAAKIAEINARTDAQERMLEREKRKREVERAKIEKALNIASIIQETAVAVIRALGSKPYTPANISLAALTGAIGAAQLAAAVATVIPAYKHGTDNHPGGIAVVGDGGRSEMAVTPDGRLYKTSDRPQLVDLPRGTKVFPDFEKEARRRGAAMLSQSQPVNSFETASIEMGLDRVVSVLKEIKKGQNSYGGQRDTLSNRFIKQTNGQKSWLIQNKLG